MEPGPPITKRLERRWRKYGRCTAITTNGRRCRRSPIKGNPEGHCNVHSKSEEERKLLMAQARAVRGQTNLKPHELMRQVVESNPLAFMQPYLDALGIRVVFVPDSNNPSLLHPTAIQDPTTSGTVLYGVSKDGDVIISTHKDIEAQQRAAERLFDRIYGKPKQTNIIAGASSQDDPAIIPFDEKRQAEVAAILEAAKSPSHNLPHNLPPNNQN
jgi:hypothetical protein